MNTSCYEKLPLVDLTAPKAISHRSRAADVPSKEGIVQDAEDAELVLKLAGLNLDIPVKNIVSVSEKYMVEARPANKESYSSDPANVRMGQKGIRRPHYTRLLVGEKNLVFQAACCLSLRIIAASLDGVPVSGRILFNSYSDEGGGKLVYEFPGSGKEMILDIKRGAGTRAQRLIFRGMGDGENKKIP